MSRTTPGNEGQGRTSMRLGDRDPRARRSQQAENAPETKYAAPLTVEGRRVTVAVGDGIKVEGGKITVDLDYIRAQLGL